MLEFTCKSEDCLSPVSFSLEAVEASQPIRCPACNREYTFPPELLEEFGLLRELIRAIQNARSILGKTAVAIEVDGHQVKIPYYLLLSKLTTELALDFSGYGFEFRFFFRPLENNTLTATRSK